MILKILYAWKLHNDSDIMLSCSSQKGANCLDNKVYSFTQLSTFVLPAITTVSKQNLMANWLVLYQCEHVWCFSEFRGLWEQCVRAEGQYPVAHCHRSWGFNCLVNTGKAKSDACRFNIHYEENIKHPFNCQWSRILQMSIPFPLRFIQTPEWHCWITIVRHEMAADS